MNNKRFKINYNDGCLNLRICSRIIELYEENSTNNSLTNKRLQQLFLRTLIECNYKYKLNINDEFNLCIDKGLRDYRRGSKPYAEFYNSKDMGNGLYNLISYDAFDFSRSLHPNAYANTFVIGKEFDSVINEVLYKTKNIKTQDLVYASLDNPWEDKEGVSYNDVIQYYSNPKNYQKLFCEDLTLTPPQPE